MTDRHQAVRRKQYCRLAERRDLPTVIAGLAQLLSTQKEKTRHKIKAYARAAKIRTLSESVDELVRDDST